MSEIQTAEKVVISNNCTCENEDGSYSEECFGCYEDAVAELDQLMKNWVEAQGNELTNTVRIEGSAMGWTRAEGYAVVEFDEVFNALKLNGDWTLTLKLEGATLTAVRTSHDEPTGASFTFAFVSDEEQD